MERGAMLQHLADLPLDDRLPVWIISYSRAGSAPALAAIQDNWQRTDDVNVLVRESQKADYQAAYPRLQVHSFPDAQINGVGRARWAAATLAHAMGEDVIIMMDDDVLKLDFLFESQHKKGKNAGAECSGASALPDRQARQWCLDERVVMGFGRTAQLVFQEEPLAVLGGLNKRHMSFSPKNHRTRYTVNGGATPRQVYVWHVDRMLQHGVQLDLERFGHHGDDIGLAAAVLAAGLDCFLAPSFVFDHWPEEVNINLSTLRTPATAPALHAEEFENLQQYPIKDYLRVKRSMVDGNYEWGDVDWVKLAKLRQRPTRHVGWLPDQPPAGPYGQPLVGSLI